MAAPQSIKRGLAKKGVRTEIISGKTRDVLPDNEMVATRRSSQATKPFIVANFLRAEFPFDTQAESGDLVRTIFDDNTYMIMNLDPIAIKGVTSRFVAILYLTNATVTVQKPTQVYNPVTFEYEDGWASVDADHENIPCLITGTRFGNEVLDQTDLGALTTSQQVCFLPRFYDVQQNFRLVFSDNTEGVTIGEVLKVDAAQRYNFPNVYEITLVQDRRK